MFYLPNPLHPALVHFPIVLLILGGIGAVVAVFTDRWNLRKWVSLFLTIGAIGAFAAVWSGDQAKETTGLLSETAENLLDQHAELAHHARNLAVAAALLGLISAFVKLKGVFRSGPPLATAVISMICLLYIVQTGHLGGQMVYQHGIGTTSTLNTVSPANSDSSGRPAPNAADD
jgi:uncharacterized membrane protein